MFTFQFRNERITNVCLFHDFVYSLKSSIYADGLFNQFFGRGERRQEKERDWWKWRGDASKPNFCARYLTYFRVNNVGGGVKVRRVFARARATPEIRYDRGKGSSANSTRSSMLDETCLIPAVADSSQNPRGSRVIAVGPNFRARRKADLPHLG